jgi:hypothetical protein
MPPARQEVADRPRTVSRIDWKDPVRGYDPSIGLRTRLGNEAWKRKTDVRGL